MTAELLSSTCGGRTTLADFQEPETMDVQLASEESLSDDAESEQLLGGHQQQGPLFNLLLREDGEGQQKQQQPKSNTDMDDKSIMEEDEVTEGGTSYL